MGLGVDPVAKSKRGLKFVNRFFELTSSVVHEPEVVVCVGCGVALTDRLFQ